jgi:hypothetical protein
MLSHMTFWLDVEKLSPAEVSRIRFWTDLYKANRDELGDDVVYPLGPDPFPGTSWVGLQSWNPDLQRGFLFAYRQGSPAASTTFALRNLRTGATYQVTDLVTGAVIGTFTAAQLQAGLLVSAPTTNAAQVLRIVRV